jgi:hypothetical protein
VIQLAKSQVPGPIRETTAPYFVFAFVGAVVVWLLALFAYGLYELAAQLLA